MTSQAQRQANLLSECVSVLKVWKNLIDQHLDGDEKASEAGALEDVVKKYCQFDFDAANTSVALQKVVDYCNEDSNDQTVDVDQLYRDALGNIQSTNFNHQQQKVWKEVFMGLEDEDVEEVKQQTSQNEDTEYEEMQDQIFYSNVFTPPVDPISKKVIADPYKNRTCGHIYEYKFILQYIKSMKNKAKCPYIGCGNRNITVSQLVKDEETENKIKNYIKNKSHSSDSDDSS